MNFISKMTGSDGGRGDGHDTWAEEAGGRGRDGRDRDGLDGEWRDGLLNSTHGTMILLGI